MKKGFTLAELLVTLGIVGVVAALTVPTLAKLRPDESKSKYLKSYAVLVDATNELLSDGSLYFPTAYTADGLPSCVGLACQGCEDAMVESYGLECSDLSDDKFAYLLSWKLGSDKNYDNATFTTKDGVQWTIDSSADTNTKAQSVQTSTVTIDVDGPDKGKNSTFGASCMNPDQFTFEVDTNGKVTPTDALGQAFLKNPNELKYTDADRKNAKKYLKN